MTSGHPHKVPGRRREDGSVYCQRRLGPARSPAWPHSRHDQDCWSIWIMATDLRLKDSLPQITARIVETYEECGATHHLGHSLLTRYQEIVEILADVRDILYAG